MTKIGIIGAGNMGGAVLAGLVAAGYEPSEIFVGTRRSEHADALREQFGVIAASNEEVTANAEVLILGVKPYDIVNVLQSVQSSLHEGQLVISLAAGITTATLAGNVPAGVEVARAMPNTPATLRQGMTLISGGVGTSEAKLALAEEILSAIGKVVRLPEELINAGTAISGSGPAYLFYIAEALIAAGVELGLTQEVAAKLVTQTLVGSSLLLEQGEAPEELRRKVTSPNGTTAAAVAVFDARELKDIVLEGARANVRRSQEIAAQS